MVKIRLELVGVEHLDKVVEWRKKPRVYSSFFSFTPASIESQKSWFMSQLSKTDENFIICLDTEINFKHAPSAIATDWIGAISLYDIDNINKRAEFGRFYIGEDACLGKGYGEEALRVLLEHGFNDIGLNKIYADVFSNNYRIIRLYSKVGFVTEAILMQHYLVSGEFTDVTRMVVLKEDYCGRD